MSFLKNLFKSEKAPETAVPVDEASTPCPHVTLVPHWYNPDDLGDNDKVTRYTCDACDNEFSREEGQQLLAAEKERLENVLGES